MKIRSIILCATILLSTSTFATTLANITVYGRSTQVDDGKEVSSLHDVYIHNESNIVRLYTMKYILCPQDSGCKTLDEFVYLNPSADFRKQTRVTMPIVYHLRGNYQLTAETIVRTNDSVEANVFGKALIQVHQ